MKLPLAWLKKYIDVKLDAQKLAEKLTLSGSKVESVENASNDAVIDIEVTSNRPDCLSILGLAREVSAITGAKVRLPKAYLASERAARPRNESLVSVFVEDKKGCPRYTARVIRDVQVKPAPGETQRLLHAAGTRAISNAVDVTNYVLYECGQPMHAFDLDKIRGGRVIVRRAKSNEKFLGIDGNEYTLDDKTLVIADAERAVAIAGVIGGKLTEVTSETKNILLESAYFDPGMVRQASKKYKISTESSYRFERGVDPQNVSRASLRAAELFHEWAGGRDASGLIDKNYLPKKSAGSITLRLSRMEKVLGLKVPQARAITILKNLSFPAVKAGADRIKVKPISARRDVQKEIDLIEEILRIEGFEKVGMKLPASRYTFEDLRDRKARGLLALKRFLASNGLDEIMTFSLLSGKKIADAGQDPADAQRVVNTTSAEQEYFRPGLLPGMLESVVFNAHRKAHALKFFEIGNRLYRGKEETVLAIGLYGAMDESWSRKSASSFYDLKGLVENVLDYLKAGAFEWTILEDHAGIAGGAALEIQGQKTGFAGSVSPRLLTTWDLPQALYYAEISLERLFEKKSEVFRVRPVAKFPSVRRDIAFIIDDRVSVRDLEGSMKQSASPYLNSVTLFDEFTGKGIPEGKRSLAFSLSYQKEDGTFTDQEIQSLQQRVGDALKKMYQAEFR